MGSIAVTLVDRQRWLNEVADLVQEPLREALAASGLKDFLHGKWLGHPLHPVLTDIPVGAWTAALVIDAVEMISGDEDVGGAADLAVGVGLAGALGAAVAGVTDWTETEGRARRIGVAHALLNVAATGLYATSLVMRRTGARRAGVGLSLLGYAVASASAYLGGHLVFNESIGVEGSEPDDFEGRFMPRTEL